MFRYAAFSAAVLAGVSSTYAQANTMDGVWARGDGKARVRIEDCGSNTCAVNVWIKPGTKGEKVGDRLIMDLEQTGTGKFEGEARDPQRGLTYDISVDVNGDSMTTRGCVLAKIVCKSVGWTKQ
ncbi:DUF2147 domain-containing protein [Rhizobium sp. L1K21]|uniref:DUF2147 domain-containing protein n=1 Tax=Rhizobium sp. L1K21 TaxID=2954933 RepID=UPI0020935BC7|nr:DUF2147 domain-containing protein [Rhizobium sp. L1K21]MCO6185267.1 DUF2147 domain-containing protein [Rhizobium sp. L1K21]